MKKNSPLQKVTFAYLIFCSLLSSSMVYAQTTPGTDSGSGSAVTTTTTTTAPTTGTTAPTGAAATGTGTTPKPTSGNTTGSATAAKPTDTPTDASTAAKNTISADNILSNLLIYDGMRRQIHKLVEDVSANVVGSKKILVGTTDLKDAEGVFDTLYTQWEVLMNQMKSLKTPSGLETETDVKNVDLAQIQTEEETLKHDVANRLQAEAPPQKKGTKIVISESESFGVNAEMGNLPTTSPTTTTTTKIQGSFDPFTAGLQLADNALTVADKLVTNSAVNSQIDYKPATVSGESVINLLQPSLEKLRNNKNGKDVQKYKNVEFYAASGKYILTQKLKTKLDNVFYDPTNIDTLKKNNQYKAALQGLLDQTKKSDAATTYKELEDELKQIGTAIDGIKDENKKTGFQKTLLDLQKRLAIYNQNFMTPEGQAAITTLIQLITSQAADFDRLGKTYQTTLVQATLYDDSIYGNYLYVNVPLAGTGYKIRQTISTRFNGNPEWFLGGALISYRLYDLSDYNRILASDNLTAVEGYDQIRHNRRGFVPALVFSLFKEVFKIHKDNNPFGYSNNPFTGNE